MIAHAETIPTDRLVLQLPRLYPLQRAAFFGPSRVSCVEASTKAGKSVGALCWILANCVTMGGSHCWIAPVYTQARVMYRRLQRILARAGTAIRAVPHDTEMRIAVHEGVIWFKGSDRPDTIYGSDYRSVVIDEASRCREEAYHAALSTTTATDGAMRCVGNVKGRGNWFYGLCRRAEQGAAGMSHHRITAVDAMEAGVIRPETLAQARAILPEHVYRELYMCEPSDDGGNPFGIEAIRRCVMDEDEEHGDTVVYGIDLAKSTDWTVVVGLDEKGRESEFARWRAPWGETRTRIEAMIGDRHAVADATGVGDPIVEELQARGLDVRGFKFTGTTKQQLMVRLQNAIQGGEVRFRSPDLVRELETYEYEHRHGGLRYSAPPGLHDDAVCALALAVWSERAAANTFEFAIF